MKSKYSILTLISILFSVASCSSSPSNIQKRISVTEYLRGPYINTYANQEEVSNKCRKISFSRGELDSLLASGVKVISTIPFSAPVTYDSGYKSGQCVGTTYILEGPEEILNKYNKLNSIPKSRIMKVEPSM
tara:strand:- start:62 stop:457 length:396 start_codon:yes stop_codon:yes gene_type:complete